MNVRYIFATNGDYVAFVQGEHLFTPDGDWLGFMRSGNEVYSKTGKFIGYLMDDDRIVRNKNEFERFPIFPPFEPYKPFRPFRPFKRLRMPRLPYPYEDVFEEQGVEAFA